MITHFSYLRQNNILKMCSPLTTSCRRKQSNCLSNSVIKNVSQQTNQPTNRPTNRQIWSYGGFTSNKNARVKGERKINWAIKECSVVEEAGRRAFGSGHLTIRAQKCNCTLTDKLYLQNSPRSNRSSGTLL